MLKQTVFVTIALLAVACSSPVDGAPVQEAPVTVPDAGGDSGGPTPVEDASTPVLDAGTPSDPRARLWLRPDGLYTDTFLRTPCHFGKAEDGSERCIPVTEGLTLVGFADPDCKLSVGLSELSYSRVFYQFEDGGAVFTGVQRTPAQFYTLASGSCAPAVAPAGVLYGYSGVQDPGTLATENDK